jgi:hypothetical protein
MGFWLIDAVGEPINDLTRSRRQKIVARAASELAALCVELAPSAGVVICSALVFGAVIGSLREASVRVLHDQALWFPLPFAREEFVHGFREAIARAHRRTSTSKAGR